MAKHSDLPAELLRAIGGLKKQAKATPLDREVRMVLADAYEEANMMAAAGEERWLVDVLTGQPDLQQRIADSITSAIDRYHTDSWVRVQVALRLQGRFLYDCQRLVCRVIAKAVSPAAFPAAFVVDAPRAWDYLFLCVGRSDGHISVDTGRRQIPYRSDDGPGRVWPSLAPYTVNQSRTQRGPMLQRLEAWARDR